MTETVLTHLDASTAPGPAGPAAVSCRPLDAISPVAWQDLCARAAEPNGFFDPAFALPAARFARGGHGGDALCVFNGHQLQALLPVTSARRALGLPIPALVAGVPYAVLGTPLLAADDTERAAALLLDAAGKTDNQLLVLQKLDLDGHVMAALRATAQKRGLALFIHNEHERAALAVPEDAEAYLRASMGGKKLKELRRLRNRLEDEGTVAFTSATDPQAVELALKRFLAIEAEGWKGKRGTGLGQNAGDMRFIEMAAAIFARKGSFEVLELSVGDRTIAAGLIIRQRDHALFFKIAYDEAFARYSPGVQLTLELTRRLSEAGAVAYVDSSALPGHPMIDHVWRERRRIGDVLIAIHPGHAGANYARLVIARERLRAWAKSWVQSIAKFREKTK